MTGKFMRHGNSIFRKSIRALLIALPFIVVAALISVRHRSDASPKQTTPATAPAVTVAKVLDKPLHQWQEFTGRLRAVNTVEVRPRVSGYIDRVAFTDGTLVKKGQLLFQIDPRPFQDDVDRLAAEQSRAAAQLALAKTNFARAKKLIKSNATSRQKYDQLAAAEESAKSTLASVKSSLQAARLNLAFTHLRAPIDGRVSRAMITVGNLVNSNDVLTTVVSQDPIYVYFDVDEQTYLRYTALVKISDGKNASWAFVGLADETGYPHRGRLDFVNNQVDPDTGTIRARAVIANPSGRFTPGLFARVRLVAGPATDTVLIDGRAIGTDLDKRFVLVLKSDHRVAYRQVELGRKIGNLRVVRRGLERGDTIVVNGLQHIKPGAKVKPRRITIAEDQATRRQLSQITRAPSAAALALERRAAEHTESTASHNGEPR
jgi:multidrug efflux system membrane fusion protein